MVGESGGHQTTLNENGSARLMAPQHEATGGCVRIGLCPVEHTVWFDVRGVLRFCAGFSCDKVLGEGQAERTWSRFSGPGSVREASQKGCPGRGVAGAA